MTTTGRPLRFLVLVLGLWIGTRTWQLWPDPPLPVAIRDTMRRVMVRADPRTAGSSPEKRWRLRMRYVAIKASPRLAVATRPKSTPEPAIAASTPLARPPGEATPYEKTPSYILGLLGMAYYGAPAPPAPTARRWSASGWAIVRGAGLGGGVATPQLGGGQAGIRLARTLDARGRVAIAARFATALEARQQEAAIGIDWRPTRLPVRVVAERRFGLANQRGGTALGLVGGIGDLPLPAGFRLDGYAQTGAVMRDRVEGYADGALRLARPTFRTAGGTVLSLGLGAWGAAQGRVARLDAGPSATLEVPIGDVPRVRIALEWRQRLAGDARPGSGPALSIGADY